MMETPGLAPVMAKMQREASDPHRGYPDGSVYCPTSRRTEGTVRMEGRVCSNCSWSLGGPA